MSALIDLNVINDSHDSPCGKKDGSGESCIRRNG